MMLWPVLKDMKTNQMVFTLSHLNFFKHLFIENSGESKFLSPIINTIKLCGGLVITLRGHRDNSINHPEVGQYSDGHSGNFIEFLNYRLRGGDIVLAEHLKNKSKNAS